MERSGAFVPTRLTVRISSHRNVDRRLLAPVDGCPLSWAAMSDVTLILSSIETGDQSFAEHLLLLVHDELRKLAAAKAVPADSWPRRASFG
jgi:hypothetical protein